MDVIINTSFFEILYSRKIIFFILNWIESKVSAGNLYLLDFFIILFFWSVLYYGCLQLYSNKEKRIWEEIKSCFFIDVGLWQIYFILECFLSLTNVYSSFVLFFKCIVFEGSFCTSRIRHFLDMWHCWKKTTFHLFNEYENCKNFLSNKQRRLFWLFIDF
jgi:hypothetical protein